MINFEVAIVKVCGLVMITYFVFDSYRKYTLAGDLEGERIRIKFYEFESWLQTYGIVSHHAMWLI